MKNLMSWIEKNHKQLSIKVYKYEYQDSLLKDLSCYNIQWIFNNKPSTGWGYSYNENIALTKACLETIERSIFYDEQARYINTSGLAMHTTHKHASENSFLEIIERDAFLCHYLTKEPFCDITSRIPKSTLFARLQLFAKKFDIELRIARMKTADHIYGIICVAFGEHYHERPFGQLVGLGCGYDFSEAINKAALECSIQLFYCLNQNDWNPNYTINKFNTEKSATATSHLKLALNNNYTHYLKRLFFIEKDLVINQSLNEIKETTKIETIQLPKVFKDTRLVCTYATNSYLQKLFFGETSQEVLNFTRLSSFAEREISLKDVELFPHPLA